MAGNNGVKGGPGKGLRILQFSLQNKNRYAIHARLINRDANMKKVKSRINAFLGNKTQFEGKLKFSGVVRIDGSFNDEIQTEGTLIVGETAVISSLINASHIIISGEVRGDINAEEKIEIHAPGRVIGNISAPTVTIDEGVVFEGHCQMENRRDKKEKKVAIFPQV